MKGRWRHSMLDRFRLLPVLIVCTGLLFGLKAIQFVSGVEQHLAGPAYAQTKTDESKSGETQAENATGEPPVMADGEEPAPGEGEGTPAVAAVPAEPVFSAAEASVLESLSARRMELDQRSREIDLREQLLRATEKRVEGRIDELKEVEARVRAYIDDQEKASEEQMASLVKMYENMKPKDAARIFERLDMGVLLSVVERMSARKMAAVLADMDPVSAQELTVELATRRQLPATVDELTVPEALPEQG